MRLVKNRRILIVDDRYDIHEDYRKILGRNENVESELEATEAALFGGVDRKKIRTFYELEFTFSGEEALKVVTEEKAKKQEFALAFVDMRMGNGMDGLETIRRLFKLDDFIQVVMSTAYSDYSWDDISTALGVNDRLLIIKKPWDAIEVLQCAAALSEKWYLQKSTGLAMRQLEKFRQQYEPSFDINKYFQVEL